jgi:release factor glutamine methyltransferase
MPPGGWLLFEFGAGQAAAVEALAGAGGLWTLAALRADLQGHPRVACLRRTIRPNPAADDDSSR